MKRYIISSQYFKPEMFKEYYIDELVDDGIFDISEIDDVLRINFGDLTEEDADLFLRGITMEGHRPAKIKKVENSNLKTLDKLGFDGGYKVYWRNGAYSYFGWHFGDPELTPVGVGLAR